MSWEAQAWAWQREDVGVLTKFLLLAICDHLGKDGFCFPGQATLARQTGMTTRSIHTHLKALEALGLLNVTQRRDGMNRRLASIYEIPENHRKDFPVGQQKNMSKPPENNVNSHRKDFLDSKGTSGNLIPSWGNQGNSSHSLLSARDLMNRREA